MSENTKYIFGIGLGSIVLAYLIFFTPFANFIFGIKNASLPPVQTTAASPEISQKSSPESVGSANIPVLRNPFGVGFVYEKSAGSSPEAVKPKTFLNLEGIFTPPGGRALAIIDDRVVEEGQTIYNWSVKQILPDKVILARSGKTKVLKLKLGVE